MMGFRWSPTIGDPSLVGWLTVVAYFVSAWMCLRAFMAEKTGPPRPYGRSILALGRVLKRHFPDPPLPARRAAIWLILAAFLFALGVNKQLDLQTLLTDIARVIAHSQGWYGRRQIVQIFFLLFMALGGVLTTFSLLRFARGALRDFRLALFGMTILVVFVVTRAASFHHIDQILGVEIVGMRLNWLLELPGILIVGTAALRRTRLKKD